MGPEVVAELALAARDVQAFRVALLDVLDRAIGFDKGSVHGMQAGHAGNATRGWDRPERFAELPRLMSELTPGEIGAASDGKPIVDTEALPIRRRDRLALYGELLRPERITVYATAMWRAGDGVGGLSLARTGRGATFSPGEREALARMLPVIRVGDAYFAARSAAPSFDAWADRVGLSAREREVAALVVRGLGNPEIATLLGSSRNTVRNQLASVFAKADVTTRAELVFHATAQPDHAAPSWISHVR